MGILASLNRRRVARQIPGQRVICVLGMHRSGTSALTGTLEEAGVHLGDVSRQNPFNRKGNREHPGIMALHDAILEANGGSWDRPPATTVWSERDRARRDRIVLDYRGIACWGFKDPRTLLVLDGWLEIIPHMEFVGTFRHPLSVADSLARRNRFEVPRSLEIWTAYNEQLLARHGRDGFPILNFDLPAQEYGQRVGELLERLGLSGAGASPAFFEDGLRTSSGKNGEPLPARVAELYERLREAAL